MNQSRRIHFVFIVIALILFIDTGCTSSSSGGSSSGSSNPSSDSGSSSPVTSKEAKKLIKEIQDQLNKDSSFALQTEDKELLMSQGLLSDNNELEGLTRPQKVIHFLNYNYTTSFTCQAFEN